MNAQRASIRSIDLARDVPPLLDEALLNAFFTPTGQLSAELAAQVKPSEEAIADLYATDTLVIAAGMYNFSVPTTLKAYLDLILRAGRTFKYTEAGPEGLVKGKKAVLILTTGGVYSTGPAVSMDHFTPYLKSALAFIGITEVEVVLAEGLALGADAATAAIEQAKTRLTELAA